MKHNKQLRSVSRSNSESNGLLALDQARISYEIRPEYDWDGRRCRDYIWVDSRTFDQAVSVFNTGFSSL